MTVLSRSKTLVKRLARVAVASGPPYAALRRYALRGDPVSVLMYHTLGTDDEDFDAWTVVRRGDFLRQIDYLRRHYEVVPIDRAFEPAAGGRPRAVLTFDDGNATLHEHLLPIVERERLPVTVYVATGQVADGAIYWFDRVMNALQTTRPMAIDLAGEGLGRWEIGAERGAANWLRIGELLERLKAVEPERRDSIARRIEVLAAASERPRFTPLAPLGVDQLRDLGRSAWITLGAHSHCHSLLDQIPLAAASESMARSQRLIREWSGQPSLHFAYPNGNHNAALMHEAQRLGFMSAVTVKPGLWRAGESRYAIARVAVGRYDDLERFKLSLLGALH
jgi:peptidoglycan/xylan/chitin deacetylase (PgdA/CDA1 family)